MEIRKFILSFSLGLIFSLSSCVFADTITVTVSTGNDDAHQNFGHEVERTTAELYSAFAYPYCGFRFQNVQVEQGATIESAYLAVYCTTVDSDDLSTLVFGEDNSTPAEFVEVNDNISDRTKTSAYVTWTNTNAGVGYLNSPDIKTVIQEIVDREDWSSGNNMVILFYYNGGDFVMASYEYATENTEAALTITTASGDTKRGYANEKYGVTYR